MDGISEIELSSIAMALAEFRDKCPSPKKNAKNPYFNSSYADLAEIYDVIKGPLKDVGLSWIQYPDGTDEDGRTILTTILVHAGSGDKIVGKLSIGARGDSAQAIGSAITYARRYSIETMLGLKAQDDDGNAATHDTKTKPVATFLCESCKAPVAENKANASKAMNRPVLCGSCSKKNN